MKLQWSLMIAVALLAKVAPADDAKPEGAADKKAAAEKKKASAEEKPAATESKPAQSQRRGPGGRGRPTDSLKVGDLAPDFTLKSLDGPEKVTLSKFRGKQPVVLIFGSYT